MTIHRFFKFSFLFTWIHALYIYALGEEVFIYPNDCTAKSPNHQCVDLYWYPEMNDVRFCYKLHVMIVPDYLAICEFKAFCGFCDCKDIDFVVAKSVLFAFYNYGQMCMILSILYCTVYNLPCFGCILSLVRIYFVDILYTCCACWSIIISKKHEFW